jgi:hypothetical protein
LVLHFDRDLLAKKAQQHQRRCARSFVLIFDQFAAVTRIVQSTLSVIVIRQ